VAEAACGLTHSSMGTLDMDVDGRQAAAAACVRGRAAAAPALAGRAECTVLHASLGCWSVTLRRWQHGTEVVRCLVLCFTAHTHAHTGTSMTSCSACRLMCRPRPARVPSRARRASTRARYAAGRAACCVERSLSRWHAAAGAARCRALRSHATHAHLLCTHTHTHAHSRWPLQPTMLHAGRPLPADHAQL
jgi:hypothetical protein